MSILKSFPSHFKTLAIFKLCFPCGTSIEYVEKLEKYEKERQESELSSTSTSSQPKSEPVETDPKKDKRFQVAIKKVLQDKRFKNRELSIMRNLSHINIVQLKFFFYWCEIGS